MCVFVLRLIYTHIPHVYMDKTIYKEYVYIKGVGVIETVYIHLCILYNVHVCVHRYRQTVLFISLYPSINIWRFTKTYVCRI